MKLFIPDVCVKTLNGTENMDFWLELRKAKGLNFNVELGLVLYGTFKY